MEHPYDPKLKHFFEAIQKEDPLGAVIRTHIYMESYLSDFIEAVIPYPNELENITNSYSRKLELAFALGLDPRFKKPLKALNKIRNEFAHEPETTLSKQKVSALFNAFSAEDKDVVEKIYQSSRLATKRQGKSKLQKRWQTLTSEDQFVLFSLVLRAIIIVATEQGRDETISLESQ